MDKVSPVIQNLMLCRAFRGYRQQVTDCIIVTTDKEFYLIDDEQKKHIVFSRRGEDEKSCRVLNPTEEEAGVMAIDNQLIANHPGGVADGAVFNTHCFHFIEFKTNAEGNTLGAIKETYHKAMEQLKETLKIFKEKLSNIGIDFTNKLKVSCHIIVSRQFPRHTATEETCQLEFGLDTQVELYFENEIILK